MMFQFGLKWDRENVKVDDGSRRVRNTTAIVPTRRSSRLERHYSRSVPHEGAELSDSSSSLEVTIVSHRILFFVSWPT